MKTHFVCLACGSVNRAPLDREGAKCGRCKAALSTTGKPAAVDDAGLDRLLTQSTVPVLVDFWANWCGPCHALAPTLEAFAKKHRGRVQVVKIDTDRDQRHAGRLEVRSIPSLVLFRGTQVVQRAAGALPAQQLEQTFASYLNAS